MYSKPACVKSICTELDAVNPCRALSKRVDSQRSYLQKQLQAAKLCAVKTACSQKRVQQNCAQQCAHGVNSQYNGMQQKTSRSEGSFCVQIPSLSLSTPPRPCLQASEKLHSPIGLLKVRVRTSLCGHEMASEPNILQRDGGALSSGNSTLMQRERGKQETKAGKRKQRFGRSVKSVGRASGEGR